MPSVYQILFVSVHAVTVALIAIPSTLSYSALAKPISYPFPPQTMSVHYVSGRSLSALKFKNLNSKANDIGPRDITSNHSNRSYYSFSGSTHPEPKVIAGAYSRSGNVNAVTNVDYISILDGYCSKAYENTQKISACSVSFFRYH
jgi:hypothetical protein